MNENLILLVSSVIELKFNFSVWLIMAERKVKRKISIQKKKKIYTRRKKKSVAWIGQNNVEISNKALGKTLVYFPKHVKNVTLKANVKRIQKLIIPNMFTFNLKLSPVILVEIPYRHLSFS